MPEMTIQLRVNPTTNKKDLVVSLKSDSDMLPHEHEQEHKALVEKLINKGLVKAGELGDIIVEREEDEKKVSIQQEGNKAQEKEAQKQGD
ncbi:MAG: hypothetical protein ACFCD0_19830 [Gemmataceae bacterium]